MDCLIQVSDTRNRRAVLSNRATKEKRRAMRKSLAGDEPVGSGSRPPPRRSLDPLATSPGKAKAEDPERGSGGEASVSGGAAFLSHALSLVPGQPSSLDLPPRRYLRTADREAGVQEQEQRRASRDTSSKGPAQDVSQGGPAQDMKGSARQGSSGGGATERAEMATVTATAVRAPVPAPCLQTIQSESPFLSLSRMNTTAALETIRSEVSLPLPQSTASIWRTS